MWHNVRILNAISNTCMAVFIIAVVTGVIGWLIQKPVYALQTVKVQSSDGKELLHVNDGQEHRVAEYQGKFFYSGSE